MPVAPCWIKRYEADGFTNWADWIEADPLARQAWAEHNDRAPESLSEDEFIEWQYRYTEGMCGLDKGHDGAHEFVGEDEIALVFK